MERLLTVAARLLQGAADLLVDALFDRLFHTAGWLALRALTLGRHPRQPLGVADPWAPGCRWTSTLGFLLLVCLPLAWLTIHYS